MKTDRTFLQSVLGDKVVISITALALILTLCMLAAAIAVPSQQDTTAPGTDMPYTGDNTPPAVPEEIQSMTLTLTRPHNADLIPYTERGFDEPVEASIAWWMNQGFMSNTSEYRWYLRTTQETRDSYYEPAQVFFDFVTDSLDEAENASVLHEDMVLYRGISGSFVYRVINSTNYSDYSYSSTAYDPTVCLNVTFGTRTSDGYQNVLVMPMKKGEHALYINEEAREILLPRNTLWDITRIANIGNLTIQTDYPLIWSSNTTATYEKVRLIYLTEME